MSPFTDPSSPMYINLDRRDVTKRAPNEPITLGDWLIGAFVVGLFAAGIVMTLLTQ